MFLLAPGEVVGGPVLRVGRSLGDFIRDDLRRLLAAALFADDLRGQDVLARFLPKLEVLAGAGDGRVERDAVLRRARLRRDGVDAASRDDPLPRRDFQDF